MTVMGDYLLNNMHCIIYNKIVKIHGNDFS